MIAFLLAQTIAITGGTVYPASGPKLANATVLIRDGRIAAVGTNVSVPSDATRIDATTDHDGPHLLQDLLVDYIIGAWAPVGASAPVGATAAT